jgi:hypothetical protein
VSIELYYFDDCPSYRKALDNLLEALRLENVDEKVCIVRVASGQDAQIKRLIGSPTIRIDGLDLEGVTADAKGYGLGCRIYSENGAMAGWPSVQMIRAALADRASNCDDTACRPLFDAELQD